VEWQVAGRGRLRTLGLLRQRRSRLSRSESPIHRLCLGCRDAALGAEAVSERIGAACSNRSAAINSPALRWEFQAEESVKSPIFIRRPGLLDHNAAVLRLFGVLTGQRSDRRRLRVPGYVAALQPHLTFEPDHTKSEPSQRRLRFPGNQVS
jgi:hypothetical protein